MAGDPAAPALESTRGSRPANTHEDARKHS